MNPFLDVFRQSICLLILTIYAGFAEAQNSIEPTEFQRFFMAHCSEFVSPCDGKTFEDVIAIFGVRERPSLLSADESVAITAYTSSAYVPINRALRSHSSDFDPFINTMVKGLMKLPNFHGIVFRFQKAPASLYANLRVGDPLIIDSFTSATVIADLCKKVAFGISPFCKDYSQVFIIHSLYGKDISQWGLQTEKEVVFLPHSQFRVLSKSESNGRTKIEMEQVK